MGKSCTIGNNLHDLLLHGAFHLAVNGDNGGSSSPYSLVLDPFYFASLATVVAGI